MHAVSSIVSLLAALALARGSRCNPIPSDYPDPTYPDHSGHQNDTKVVGKAIYFLTNEDTNAVVALPIGQDGKLSQGTVTETGGGGSVAVDGNGQPATPDALVGQSAITISGKYLFAVNAGSNTLSVLSIDPSDPTHLALVGDPVAVPGEFINTVAVSIKNNLVCAATTGAKAGVSCGPLLKEGLGPFDERREIDLDQTTPPAGPPNTISQVLFSEDESVLYAIVKGNPAAGTLGFISAYPVSEDGSSVSRDETRSSPEGTDILFGTQVVPGTNDLVLADASFGAAVVSVDPQTLEATTLARAEIEGQNATCWASISDQTGTAFLTDAFVSRLVELDVTDGSIVSTTDLPDNDALGTVEVRAVGDFVYALAPGNGTTEAAILAADVSKSPEAGTQIQRFGLDGVATNRAQGLIALN